MIQVLTKLGGVDSGSVGSPNCGWLPTRVDKVPYQTHMPHQIQTTKENATLITA